MIRSIVSALLTAAALAARVQAQGPLEIYFSLQGDITAIPSEYTTQANLIAAPGDSVYMWANVTPGDRWISYGIDFVADGSIVGPDTGFNLYNPVMPPFGWPRWNWDSDFDARPDSSIFGVAVGEAGLGHVADILKVAGTGHYLVGEFIWEDVGSPYDVFMSVNHGAILMWGGSPPGSPIFFGFGDDPVSGYAFGATSTIADLTIVPEPASFLLLALVALALRRR